MNRRTWMACLVLLVAASVGSTQPPSLPAEPVQPTPTPTAPAEQVLPAPAPTAPAEPVPTLAAKPVAMVGDVAISFAELKSILDQSDPVPVPLSERQQTQNQMRALGMLIDGILMRKFLDANTQPIAPAEIQRRLAEMEAGLRKQDKSLAEFCQETNKTLDQLKADIADQLRWSAYLSTKLTDVKLRQSYTDNKDFFDGVTVRVSHIVIRIPTGAIQADKDKARATLMGLRNQLVSDPKSDFDEVAKNQPDKGGDLGVIPRKWFDEKFSRAAFSLPKGEISEVVQTDFGLHLIKVTDRQPGKASDYTKVREAVREFCAQDERQTIIAQQRKVVEVKYNLP